MRGSSVRMDAMTDTIVLKAAGTVVHPTAIVARGAELGAGVRVGPYCTVGAHVVIEDRSELVSHVVVDGHTRIGPDVVLYPFCTVGLAPQDLKYAGQPTRCEIGARTQVREHCTIHRGTVTGKGITRVGAAQKVQLERMGIRVIDASKEGWGIINHDLFLSNSQIRQVIRDAVNGHSWSGAVDAVETRPGG